MSIREPAIREPARPSARFELKSAWASSSISELRALVRCHPAAFRPHWPERQVNNLYFDDARFGCLHDNLAGVVDRSKLRIRWYGAGGACPGVSSGPTRLELKTKRGRVGYKQHVRLGPLPADPWDFRPIERWLREQDLGPLTAWPALLPHLTLFISYQRGYWLSADGRVRLTLDWDLRMADRTHGAGGRLRPRPTVPAVCVLELKADVADGPALRAVAGAFPLRTAAFSKYVAGVAG